MSLKAFHVFFIIVATLAAIGFGIWGILDYRQTGTTSSLLMACGSLVAGVLLVFYFRWFLRKLKDVSYL